MKKQTELFDLLIALISLTIFLPIVAKKLFSLVVSESFNKTLPSPLCNFLEEECDLILMILKEYIIFYNLLLLFLCSTKSL